MAEHTFSARTYVIVCVVLVLLTVLTVGLSFLPLLGPWHLAFGLSIALCKAALVVLFFMHVLVGQRLVRLVVAVSCAWLLLLLVLTLTDYYTRDLVPFMPGH